MHRSDTDPDLLRWACPGGLLDRRRLRFLTPAQRVVVFGGTAGWRQYAEAWGLVSHWKLDETAATGNAIDAYGTNTLTAANSPAVVAAGKMGGARNFVATSSQNFEKADPFAIGDADAALTYWMRIEAGAATRPAIAKWSGSAGNREFQTGYNSSERAFWQVRNADDVANATVTDTTFGVLAAGAWYFIFCYHDATNNVIGLSVNGNAFETAACAAGVLDTAQEFGIGGTTGASFFQGDLDAVSFFKPTGVASLAGTMRDILWNSGKGRPF